LGDQSVIGNLYVALYSDSLGVPDAQVTGFGFNNPTGPAASDYLFTPTSAVSLLPGTTYWVVAYAVDGGSDFYSWYRTADTGQTGASGWSIGDDLYEHASSGWAPVVTRSNPALFSVQGNAVPLPGTALLLGPGLALMGWTWRRRTTA